jgi:ribosomal protein S18 acetylase RimI-like enzyme
MSAEFEILEFEEKDRRDVVTLWKACELTRPWNDPDRDIDRVLNSQTGKLFLLKKQNQVSGSVMVGYDGHRGSVYYLSVHPDLQRANLGSMLMAHAEEYLLTLGCPKLNLMVRTTNLSVVEFYDRLEYLKEEVIVFSKRLITDQEPQDRMSSEAE